MRGVEMVKRRGWKWRGLRHEDALVSTTIRHHDTRLGESLLFIGRACCRKSDLGRYVLQDSFRVTTMR